MELLKKIAIGVVIIVLLLLLVDACSRHFGPVGIPGGVDSGPSYTGKSCKFRTGQNTYVVGREGYEHGRLGCWRR